MLNSNPYHFSDKREDEEMITVIHRHWFNILQNLFLIFTMLLLLFGSYAILPALFPILADADYQRLLVFFESLFAMLIWIMFFLVWIDYYFDVWIITSKRIVNITQRGLFSREVSEVELDKIQDVSAEVLGIIPTFLNYGDVQIQTAAEQEKFLFEKVADPYALKNIIMNLEKSSEKQTGDAKARTEAEAIRTALEKKTAK
ncbi:MAG: PH domain-containing protein [Candidatus Moranbacteria bacterium]|nr:PH domain-containing protein [bacterium]MDP1833859.1 PH domain-containing protein [Candidatus Moranbacteria bacterium]